MTAILSKSNMNVGESTALTVIPLKDDKVFYYNGELGKAMKTNAYGITGYSMTDGFGQVVRTNRRRSIKYW